jgi:exopolysaccharide biosynthesis polyprenyl glycosylphosphotransferase
MNQLEQSAVLPNAALYDEVSAVVDERTLEILERRKSSTRARRRGWLVRRMLLAADFVGLTVAFMLAQLLVPPDGSDSGRVGSEIELLVFLGTLPIWLLVARLYGLYDHDEERTDHSTVDDFVGVLHLVTIGAWVFFAISWATRIAEPYPSKLLVFWTIAIGLVVLARSAARSFCRRRIAYLQNTVIVGAGDVGQLIARKLMQHPEYGINLIGFVDSQPKDRRPDLEHLTLLGDMDRLPAIVRMFDVERVVIAFSNESHERLLKLVRSLKRLNVQVDIVPRLFEVVGPNVGVHTVEGLPLFGLPPLHLSKPALIVKRSMDVIVSGLALVLLAPLLLAIALLVKLDSPGPVLFRQIRMGREDRTFRIFKFRTMTVDADSLKERLADLNLHARAGGDPRMFKILGDPRMTRVGAVLRRYSLDELPQLLNVIRGEMSLVGPRPLILDEDQYVEEWARNRLDLKPGMTGLWQTLGRSEIPFEEMVRLDYFYVTSWSLWNDIRLLVRTLPLVLRGASGPY